MKSIILTICLLFSISLLAQEPATDAVYEKISEEYTLLEDGSVEYHYYKKLKYNTHFSFNRLYGETFIVYNPAYQKLTIDVSQTTMPDGKVVEGPFNSYNEVLPRFAADAPVYNGLREMVVTHPGLEVGSVVELEYTIKTQPGFYPGLMADLVLTQSSPVMEHTVTVQVPPGETLEYRVLNLRTSPEVEENASGKSYRFSFSDIKENSHEAHQPADELHMPRLYFSTLSFNEAIAEITKQDAFVYKLNDAMASKVKEVKEKSNNELLLILELQKLVAGELNTYGIPPQTIGYTMRTPIETWNSHGGTPCEKTLLLAALLREAGINANPVMVFSTKLYDEKNACLPLAENFLLQVNPREKEQMYLSAVKTSDQNMIFSMNDKTILLFEPGKNYVESIEEAFVNKVITSGDFVVSDDFKVAGKMETSLTEQSNPYYSFLTDSAYAKKLITGGLSSGDVVSSELINSAQFRTLASLTIDSKKAMRQQGDYYFWELPGNKSGTTAWGISYLHADRSSPFEIPFVVDEEYSYSITLADGVTLVNPVELTERNTDFGKLVLSTTQKGNKLTIKRLFMVNQTTITPEEYADFKEMLDLWNEKNFTQLVLKKEAKP